MFSLFDAYDDISFGLELPDGLYRAFPVCPVHREFRTERGLVDLGGGRGGTDAAEDYAVGAESVAGAEGRTDVVTAADIVQNHCYGAFGEGLVFLDCGRPSSLFNNFLNICQKIKFCLHSQS